MSTRAVQSQARRNRCAWLATCFALSGGFLWTLTWADGVLANKDAGPAIVAGISPAAPPDAAAGTQPSAEAPASAGASLPASQPASRPVRQPTTAPSTQPRDPELTVETIESYKRQILGSQGIPDVERDNIVKIYDKALDQLKMVDYWQGQITRFEEAIKQVPDQLEKASAKLKQPVEDLAPHSTAGATLQQIDQQCKQADELDRAARMDASSLTREQQSSQDRRQQIQNRRNAIRQALADLGEQLNGLQSAGSQADQALRILLRAQRRALYRENTALEKQGNSDDARQELLTVQIRLASRYQDATSLALAQWKDILKQRRSEEAAKVAAQASQQSMTLRDRPELFDIAEQNRELAGRRVALQSLVDEIQTMPSRDELMALRRSVAVNSQGMAKRIETAGLTEAVSSLLRRQRALLPDVLQHERNVRRLEAEIAKAQIELIDLEDQRSGLVNIDRQINVVLRGLKNTPGPQEQEKVRAEIEDLLQTKLTYLNNLISDYNTCTKTWLDLEEEERFLIVETGKYADYIDEHILWVRSSRPLQPSYLRHAWSAVCRYANPAGWADAGKALLADAQANLMTVAMGAVLLAALVGLRRRFRLRLRQIDEIASKGYTYAFIHTLEAMGLTLLLSITWPGLLWFVGWRLSTAVTSGELTGMLAAGMYGAGTLLWALELLRQVCRPKGLGQTHFHWPTDSMQLLRDNLAWFMPVTLPLVFIYSAIDWQANTEFRDSLGRVAFIASMIALAVFARRLLRPAGALMGNFLQRRRDGWLDRLRFLWYPSTVAIPALLALGAALGYYYTATQIASRLVETIALIFLVLVAKALLTRLLFVARRRLALETVQKRKAAQAHPQDGSAPTEGHIAGPVDSETTAPAVPREPEVDLATVDAQTRRLVRVAILFTLALGLYFTWVDMLPALGILDRVQLWSTTVDVSQTITNTDGTKSLQTTQKLVPITLASVAWAGLIMLVAIIAAKNIPGLLEITVLRLVPMEPGGRYAINAIGRYLITILGLIMAFGAVGIGWSKVQWLAAAVTVGLGFGLQEIFANFISGIIILFERPVRVGDVISVGDISGTVSKIRIRATTIVDWNRKELIVPNKQFITSQMVNWTLSDPILRLVISVGVPHGADPDLVRKVLLRVATGNPRVLENPKPSAFLLGLTSSSMDFSLRVFVPGPDVILAVQDELHAEIDEALREAGVEVAFSRSPG